MIRFLADENFNINIVLGLRQRNPYLDIVRVQEVGLTTADDPVVLEWAAEAGRVVLTHDVPQKCGVQAYEHTSYPPLKAHVDSAGVCIYRKGLL